MWKKALAVFSLVVFLGARGIESRRRRRRRRAPPPCSSRNCVVSGWSSWGGCSHQCGTSGTQRRTRSKTSPAACGGSCPYHLTETRACNRNSCKNGGTPHSRGCSCRAGYKGTCCEGGMCVCAWLLFFVFCFLFVFWRTFCLISNNLWSISYNQWQKSWDTHHLKLVFLLSLKNCTIPPPPPPRNNVANSEHTFPCLFQHWLGEGGGTFILKFSVEFWQLCLVSDVWEVFRPILTLGSQLLLPLIVVIKLEFTMHFIRIPNSKPSRKIHRKRHPSDFSNFYQQTQNRRQPHFVLLSKKRCSEPVQ